MSLSICSALATGGMCALQRMGAIEALEAAVAMLNIQTVQCIFITNQFCWTFSTHTLTRAYSLIPWNPGHHRNGVVNALPSCNTIVELTSMLFVIQAHTESAKVSGCFCSAKRMESIKFRWRRTWLPVIQSAAQWCVVPTIDELETKGCPSVFSVCVFVDGAQLSVRCRWHWMPLHYSHWLVAPEARQLLKSCCQVTHIVWLPNAWSH